MRWWLRLNMARWLDFLSPIVSLCVAVVLVGAVVEMLKGDRVSAILLFSIAGVLMTWLVLGRILHLVQVIEDVVANSQTILRITEEDVRGRQSTQDLPQGR